VCVDSEVLEKLGQGGMGVVYRARQRSANRIVALKLIRADRLHDLPPEARQQWLTRFQTEAQAAARIEHDHVVAVYEVGEIDGTPFTRCVTCRARAWRTPCALGP